MPTQPTPPALVPTVPRGGRLLHIGPHKTGTTALQGAFHSARDRLPAYDVVYAGSHRQPVSATLAKIGVEFPGPAGTPVREELDVFLQRDRPGMERWRKLVQQCEQAGDRRTVISSEYFSNAGDDAAREVVADLGGGGRVHVVVTLRPLLKILPSQWQQYVRNGLRSTYEDWLDAMFHREPCIEPTPSFWRRHRHDELIARWAAAAGPENVTVLVQDESDQQMQLRVFEEFAGLPAGFLVYDERDNRSMTHGEAELVRLLNEESHRRGWSVERHGKVVRAGALRRMRDKYQPSRDEARVTTPEWAVAEATELAEEMTAAISALGVNVVGDLASLSKRPSARAAPPAEATIPAAAAAQAVIGALLAQSSMDTKAAVEAAKRDTKAAAAAKDATGPNSSGPGTSTATGTAASDAPKTAPADASAGGRGGATNPLRSAARRGLRRIRR
ncbi:hypothetical protein ACHZ98_06935 [Streptomyces sp. MAR4 CNY-716]